MTIHTDERLILLHDTDNIYVCCRKIAAGETIRLEGNQHLISCDINVGHKLARSNIAVTEKIYKYGVPIGSAKAPIQCAEHVHLHNLKSDYMSSYQRSGLVDDSLEPTSRENKQ